MNPLPLGRCSVRVHSNQCHRWAKIPCAHCFQPICLEHEQMHLNPSFNEKSFEEFVNEINDLKEKISSLNRETLLEKSKEKMRWWKNQQIEAIESKSNEIHRDILERMERIQFEQIRSNLSQQIDSNLLQRSQNRISTEDLRNQLRKIQNQIDDIYRSIDFSPDRTNVVSATKELKRFERRFSAVQSVSHCLGPMCGGGSDSEHLLLFQHQPDYSLLLFNANEFLRRIPIDHFVNDILWSNQRQIFFILTDSFLYEFDSRSQRLSPPKRLNASDGNLYSLTCHSTNLFILQKPDLTIYRRDFVCPYSTKDQWKKHEFLHPQTDRTAGSIRSNETLLGMTIEQTNYQWRLDLFAFHSHRFERVYCSSPFGQTDEIHRGFCRLIPSINHSHQWFICYSIGEQHRLVLIDQTNDEQLVDAIDRQILNLTTIKPDQLVLLDSKSVQFYSN